MVHGGNSVRVPVATYRLQFNESFGFAQAAQILPFLHELGISDIYASPIFRAKKGSQHGYDVTDPNQLNPELGSRAEFERLMEQVKTLEMGWLQDIVPNHTAYDSENSMLMDVFENGENSAFFDFFDVQWDHPDESLRGKILTPFLGKPYSEALKAGEIQLQYDEAGLHVCYYDIKLPLRLDSYQGVFAPDDAPDQLEILAGDKSGQNEHTQTAQVKQALWGMYQDNPAIKGFMDSRIALFNGSQSVPSEGGDLDRLLSRQFLKLAYWREANKRINYRRFFYISDFIALNVGKQHVFDYTHRLIMQLLEERKFTGLRIDHIDGLYDPLGYLRRIQEHVPDTYVVVEKILDLGEKLPSRWPVQGTTGYDFLNYVNGVFCRTDTADQFARIYEDFAGSRPSYEELLHEKKQLIIEKYMAGELENLTYLLEQVGREYERGENNSSRLRKALVQIIACFPVYRTYVRTSQPTQTDRAYIAQATTQAKEKNPDTKPEIDFIEKLLFLKTPAHFAEKPKEHIIDFAMRFQQLTSPVMAKGFEDTFLYNYNRFVSLNEVGGSPDKFGITLDEFHEFSAYRASDWPASLNATATHDTKRGEDVRARLNVLSEIPEQWQAKIDKWHRMNQPKKKRLRNGYAPDENDEYLLYQTLVGAFPFDKKIDEDFAQRIKDYFVKTVREAKVHTTWIERNVEYEQACARFIDQVLNTSGENDFLNDFVPFQQRIAHFGILNSLSQTLIKITSPGVPDFYQGTELWDFSLVDPDNRRPVDFSKRTRLLKELRDRAGANVLDLISELLAAREDGRIKLFLIQRALQARNENKELFNKGTYVPLEVEGSCRNSVISFARVHKANVALTIGSRFLTSLIGPDDYPLGRAAWRDTAVMPLPPWPRTWRDVLTGQEISSEDNILAAESLAHFPVALLVGKRKDT
jgi:(1->4)-alpha-D-glucan 1-alpha-D-glucosylmutase